MSSSTPIQTQLTPIRREPAAAFYVKICVCRMGERKGAPVVLASSRDVPHFWMLSERKVCALFKYVVYIDLFRSNAWVHRGETTFLRRRTNCHGIYVCIDRSATCDQWFQPEFPAALGYARLEERGRVWAGQVEACSCSYVENMPRRDVFEDRLHFLSAVRTPKVQNVKHIKNKYVALVRTSRGPKL